MTLFDLKERKVVWTITKEGSNTKSLLGSIIVGGLYGALGQPLSADDKRTVTDMLTNIMKDMPAVSGFRPGGYLYGYN